MKFTIEQVAAATTGKVVSQGKGVFAGIGADSRRIGAGELFVPLRGPNFDGHDYISAALDHGAGGFIFEEAAMKKKAAKELAAAKGAAAVAVRDSLYALGELARSARERFPDLSVVAITGSAGKSTTKEMVATILAQSGKVLKNEGNMNNRVGLPMTLFGLTDRVEYLVVELGTNEPGEIERLAEIARPQVACVTNVGPVHLEGLGNIEGVAKEKGALPKALTKKDVFAANLDDPYVMGMAGNTRARIIAYGLPGKNLSLKTMVPSDLRCEEAVSARGVKTDVNGSSFVLVTSEGDATIDLPVPGKHNVINALAAAAIARALDKKIGEIVNGIERFKPLPMRTQVRLLEKDVVVIEDCYNSNPISVAAALDLLTQNAKRTIAVLGEMRELGDAAESAHEHLGGLAALRGVDVLITLGEHAAITVKGFQRNNKKGRAFVVKNAEEAGRKVSELLEPADRVLLKASRLVRLEDAFPIIEEKWNKAQVKENKLINRLVKTGREAGRKN